MFTVRNEGYFNARVKTFLQPHNLGGTEAALKELEATMNAWLGHEDQEGLKVYDIKTEPGPNGTLIGLIIHAEDVPFAST